MPRTFALRGLGMGISISVLLTPAMAWVFSSPAMAWVKVCNGRSQDMTAAVAIGAKDPPGVTTNGHLGVNVEGWWRLSPGECKQVSQANASESLLYFHAHGEGAMLQGDARLCVRSQRFSSGQQFLIGGQTCSGDWREAGFIRQESSSKNFRFTIN